MVSVITFCAYFVLSFCPSCCPGWGNGIPVEERGCPNLYKRQKTNVAFYDPLTMEPHTYGNGQCAAFGTLQCWPGFRQPFYEDTGQDATYYYRQWIAQVDHKVVVTPQFEEPFCDISFTQTFREPMNSGKCLKPTPTPTPTPSNEDECESVSWFWNPTNDSCNEEAPPPCFLEPLVCDPGSWNFEWCGCVPYSSPIIVDVAGNGFNLTNVSAGVIFNLNSIGGKEKLAWTNGGSDDVWLVLDRNGNGTIDDGTELFGDVTPQPDPPAGEKKNGFLALAEYDKLVNGGNANGQIESGDSIFSSLRLWRDANHNGLSEPSELDTLPSRDVVALELDYKLSKKTDNHGNQFSFRAKIRSSNGQQLGRWAWDVYLVRDPE